jgi:hypothetical protein
MPHVQSQQEDSYQPSFRGNTHIDFTVRGPPGLRPDFIAQFFRTRESTSHTEIPSSTSSSYASSTTSSRTTLGSSTTEVGIGSTSNQGSPTSPTSDTLSSTSTSSATAGESMGTARRTSSRGAIIGGVFGGLAFLAAILGLGLLYRRSRLNFDTALARHRLSRYCAGEFKALLL